MATSVETAIEERITGERSLAPTLLGQCVAEVIGTFILILLGTGAVAVAVHVDGLSGWGVALMWGLAVTFAIYVAGPVSGAHLNPAVTLSMAVFRGFPPRHILPFALSQLTGAFIAAACVYGLWLGFWETSAARLGVTIGEPGSQKLMMVFSCFYPNPGGVGVDSVAWATIGTPGAFLTEMLLTAFLLLMVFALTEPNNPGMPQAGLGPVFIGLTVSATIGIGGPLTMDAINPVRDLGPRLFSYLAGFGPIAFPGPRGNEWWLYIVAPLIGGVVGGLIYRFLVRPHLPRPPGG